MEKLFEAVKNDIAMSEFVVGSYVNIQTYCLGMIGVMLEKNYRYLHQWNARFYFY